MEYWELPYWKQTLESADVADSSAKIALALVAKPRLRKANTKFYQFRLAILARRSLNGATRPTPSSCNPLDICTAEMGNELTRHEVPLSLEVMPAPKAFDST